MKIATEAGMALNTNKQTYEQYEETYDRIWGNHSFKQQKQLTSFKLCTSYMHITKASNMKLNMVILSVVYYLAVNKLNCMTSLVKNKYSKMYLKYIYFMLSIQQIHLHIYVLNTNTLQFWFTKLVYLNSAKLEQLILYLMHFNCAEVVMKSNWRYTEVYLIVLKWNYCKYTLGTLISWN